MKKLRTLLSILIFVPLLSSCHGVYVTADYADDVYKNIISSYADNAILPQTRYTYSAKQVDGDTSIEYYSIYSKESNFYYHYQIGKTWDINSSSWIYEISESWKYVANDSNGVLTIFQASRISGTNHGSEGGCYDYTHDAYSDIVWAQCENSIYEKTTVYVRTYVLPLMKTYIDMAQSETNTADILFASNNANSLYIEAEEQIVEGQSIATTATISMEDNLLASFNYKISDKKYMTFSSNFSKATVTYPDLIGNSCTKNY